MRTFILQENLALLSAALGGNLSAIEREYLRRQIVLIKQELTAIDAARLGAQRYPREFGGAAGLSAAELQRLVKQSDDPTMVIDPRAGLHILHMNEAHSRATLRHPASVAGHKLLEAFPDNPELEEGGSAHLIASIRSACITGSAAFSEPQRYDIRDAAGQFLTRYWQTVSIPTFDADGRLQCIVHRALDVTDRIVNR